MKFSKVNKSIIFLGLIFLIVLGAGLFIFSSLKVDPIKDKMKNDPVLKVLFVVHDGNGNCLSTDIFMYSPATSKSALFNILGNTGSIFSSIGRVDRIDAIYSEKGIDVYRKEIEELVDQNIPFSVEISTHQLGILTDLLGGLKVFVPSPVDYENSDGKRWLLPSGAVTLDGDKIQTFLEYSLPDESSGDSDDRHQNALVALFTAIKENKKIVFKKKNFPYFAAQFDANVDDDGLKKLLLSLTASETDRLVPTAITGNIRVVDGKSLLFPYYNGQLIKEVVEQSISTLVSDDSTMQNGVYVLEILNGTLERGLARNTSFLLQSAGYKVLEAANADRSDYEHTVIINHNANSQAVQVLADFIRCKNIRSQEYDPEDYENTNAARADFTIILGKDFDGRRVVGGYQPSPEELEKESENLSYEEEYEDFE